MSSNTTIFYTILNVLAILCIILSLVGNFMTYFFWNFILIGIFKIILVVLLLAVEFMQTPALIKPFSFMFYFLGRGLCNFGFLTMGIDILSIIAGFILVLLGIIYIGIHFASRNKEPESMSFVRYQRLTSGMSHELPTAANRQNTYPVAQQVPLSQPNPSNHVLAEKHSQTQISIAMPVQSTEVTDQEKTEEKTEV
ncbi:hypothetical protein CU098_007974 [Rhizopus stolonifer]|uniref:COPI associated protein n=1 Tax=Rhizopus stolonifer TaxID=4846 RepID=A0A367J6J1_RHIST|nr:hypothetical protein CU098_007974 [Rhizopus stolonifer]